MSVYSLSIFYEIEISKLLCNYSICDIFEKLLILNIFDDVLFQDICNDNNERYCSPIIDITVIFP